MKYVFNATLVFEGRKAQAGDVLDEAEIPAGNLQSMLRLGQVSKVAEPEPEAPTSGEPSAEPAEPPKRGRGRPPKQTEPEPQPEPEAPTSGEPSAEPAASPLDSVQI